MIKPIYAIYLLISMYLAGIIGLANASTTSFFQLITPLHLIFCSLVLVFFQENKNKYFWAFTVFCFFAGYTIEIIGVKTGLIFGQYGYQTTLGPKLFMVPPVIGINWLIMILCVGTVTQLIFKKFSIAVQSIIGSLAMTLFDFLVEPVAIKYNMWHWFNNEPPLQNYIGWSITSFFLLFIFFKTPFAKQNKLALTILVLQWVFFCTLNMI